MRNKFWTIALAAMLIPALTTGQVKLSPDTLECHVIHFSAGLLAPGTGSTSGANAGSTMRELYKGPYLDFAIGCDYMYQSGWMVTLDGDLWIGNDNLRERSTRLGSIYGSGGYALTSDGVSAGVEAYNRNLALRLGVAKVLNVLPGNPNSGILLKLSGGWMMQKSAFSQQYTENPVPQLTGDYARLYDNLRNGVMLTEGIGFQYMSNYLTYVNLRVTLEVSQCWSRSSRPYQIDGLTGLNGKDNNSYFDMMYGLKLTWMFPLMGKTTYDYYY